MVSTAPETTQPTAIRETIPAGIALQGEQRVVIHGVTWKAYLQILTVLPNNRSTKLTFDQGTLEITMPLEDHDFSARMIGRFIWLLVEELGESMGFDIKTIGSTTLNYPGLERGAEPDESFYIQNHALVAGRTINFAIDPPPDIVVEVDITHTDIRKNQFYASIGVPEFWRFNGKILKIYHLQGTETRAEYIEVATSPTFPLVPKSRLYEFLEQSCTSEVQASKALRIWAQQLIAKP